MYNKALPLDPKHIVIKALLLYMISFSFGFFSDLNKNPVEGFSAGLADDEDIYKWEVLIIGPQDTL